MCTSYAEPIVFPPPSPELNMLEQYNELVRVRTFHQVQAVVTATGDHIIAQHRRHSIIEQGP